MSATAPKVSKAALDKAVAELDQLTLEIITRTARAHDLRNKMANLFHTGESGTQTTELHGYEIKTNRTLNISLPKDAAEQLADDDPDLYDEVYPEKTSRSLNNTVAKKRLDDLEDYVVTKQGLPTITIKRIEE